MPRRSPYVIELSKAEREELSARARKYTSPYRDVIRAKIVLLAAAGLANDVIAARLDTPRQVVSKWRKRFYRVVCENSGQGLRGLAVVELEHAAEPLTAFQRTCSDHLCPGRDELVAKALVRPFLMVMIHELSNGSPEVLLAERDDSLQALGLRGQDEPFRIGVEVWTPGGRSPRRRRCALRAPDPPQRDRPSPERVCPARRPGGPCPRR
jgi:Homeodomain-like domain